MNLFQMFKAFRIFSRTKTDLQEAQTMKKPWYESLTIISNAVIALVAVIPGVETFIANHPGLAAIIVAVTNIGMRLRTDSGVK